MENQKNIEKSLVERDSEGLPRAWRLFTVGDNIVTDQEGDGTLRMKKEDIDTIVERFETKGLEIPVDGDHYLEHLAKEKGMDADELVKSSPYKEGEGTLGFGKLEKREDGLWLSVEKWNEAAKLMIKEGQYRYFSPYIKGLDGKTPLRVTSVALTNNPKLNGIPEIGCSEFNAPPQPLNKEANMTEDDKKKNAGGCAEPSLDGAASPQEDDPATMKARIAELEKENAELKEQLKEQADDLGLSENDPAKLKGAMKGLIQKAAKVDSMSQRLEALELSEKNRKVDLLIEEGLDTGKITTAEAPHLRKLGEAGLAEYLKAAAGDPKKVPIDRLGKMKSDENGDVSLSEEDRHVAKLAGMTEAEFLAAKKAQTKTK